MTWAKIEIEFQQREWGPKSPLSPRSLPPTLLPPAQSGSLAPTSHVQPYPEKPNRAMTCHDLSGRTV